MDTRTARAVPVLLALGCTWGASFLFIKVVLDSTGPIEVAFGRSALGFLAVAAYFLATRREVRASRNLVGRAVIMSVLSNVIPFCLIAWAETHITSGTASILNATVPIFTTIVAVAVLDEDTLTPQRLGGLLLGFVGVVVVTGGDIAGLAGSNLLAELAVVGAAAMYGAGAVYSRQTLRGQDSASATLIQLGWSSLLLLPMLLAVRSGAPDFTLSLKAWGSILGLGVFGTGMAYIAYLWLIQNIGSVRTTLVTYMVPGIAVVLGWLALGDSIGLNGVAGGLLIVAGVASVVRGQAPPARELTVIVPAGIAKSVSAD